ncbi:two-component system C4-dicarboxylate transport sensor histidine kinase DctB [Peteryoungia aggregata LMG 23059]|uniref:C4-dicarboxylate transport sensor protein n=1 Tax=Peteryoungia aggregata LMG 23059 TaxID=1368425 RepID=A0ABU0G9P2_9HYPH|nr:ATP-binding protein [Peteryoungia aggregata]MDQ0422066.1 two-component system C4-dicarboxylate transport sensor histidine kinase DctB [Peteryoungia aggregata LMG 23059]
MAIVHRNHRLLWLAYGLAAMAILASGLFYAGERARHAALDALAEDVMSDAELKRALLLAVLDRSRTLPLVLANDGELVDALAAPSAEAIAGLNEKLEALPPGTGASVIYVIGLDGTAIAASNFRQPDSFVGSNYAFRQYFTGAMTSGTAEQYALGSVSRRPGLYLSRRVEDDAGRPLGVVVVKVEFDALEANWQRSVRTTYVTDTRGIVLITSRPDWRFFTMADIPQEDRLTIRESLQFGEAPLETLPIWSLDPEDGHTFVATEEVRGMPHETNLSIELDVPGSGWRMHVLAPSAEAERAAIWQGRLTALAIVAPLLALGAWLIHRSGSTARRTAEAKAAQAELERQVSLRTVELTEARDRLEAEIAEHRATDIRLQGVQQDLVQANRLAILGQVAAGVAHEINQPVATIRAYADNAKAFLDRGNGETAKENLGLIAELTDRIGAITGELKGLARKGRQAAEPVELKAAIDGALFLLKSRFAGSFDRLTIGDIPKGLMVLAQRIRLEQVLINLLQNALEAIDGTTDPAITIRLTRLTDGELDLAVSDTGPGLPDYVRDHLFIPFTTSKDGGLGLGLVIARDIVGEYGGRLSVETSAAGTTFTITLKRARA